MPTQDRIDTYEMPNGTQIPIRDSRVDNLAAGDVSYDNTESGLQASDVQAALDELAEGGGGADYVELTQAEYDLLTPAEKHNGKMYFITDAPSGGGGGGSSTLAELDDTNISSPSNGQILKYNTSTYKWENANESGGSPAAEDVSYDNTVSGLEATEVQSAIDELNSEIDNMSLDAGDVSYDNTDSGMQATDVQEAIDELKSDMDNYVVDADQVDYDNTTSGLQATDVQNAIDELSYEISNISFWTDVTGTLTAGQTSITLSNAAITTTSTIEVFNDLDVPYNSKTLSTGSITLTFDAQQSNMSVKVRVS